MVSPRVTNYIIGAPSSTTGKPTFDGFFENYAITGQRLRREINFHNANGTEIPAIIETMVAGTIGGGVNVQCRTGDNEIDDAFEDLLTEASEIANFEITGRFHFAGALRAVVANKWSQGGFLVRYHYNSSWKIPLRPELIGVDMIDTSRTNRAENLINGIKKDSYGRIVGIYLFTDPYNAISTLFPMTDMEYYMNPWLSLSQYTAISRLSRVLGKIDEMYEYSKAEISSAEERAKAGVYWSTELYSEVMDAFKEHLEASNFTDEQKLTAHKDLIRELAARGVGVTGATAIPSEDKIYQVNTNTESVFDVFTDHAQRSTAAAIGGSSAGVYGNMKNTNYATIKAMISSDDETYRIEFDDLKNGFIQSYLRRLFQVGVQIGKIPLSREEFFANPRKFYKFDILRTSRRVIDETKDADATKTNLATGITTKPLEYGKRGLDYYSESMKAAQIEIAIQKDIRAMYEKEGLPMPTPAQDGGQQA